MQQPHFGNLPLVAFAERFDFAKSIVWDVISDPDDEQAVGAFHTQLQFYAIMCDKRRYADRLLKRKTTTAAQFYSFNDGLDAEQEADDLRLIDDADSIEIIFRQIRDSRNLACGCVEPDWRNEIGQFDNSHLTVSFSCGLCGRSWPSERIPIREVRRLVHNSGGHWHS